MGHAMDDENERRVRAKMAQLVSCGGDFRLLHEGLAQKRLAWWQAVGRSLALDGPLPRRAYQLVLLEYMSLDPGEVPVVYEDESRITWRSFNVCPVLEACLRLGLDTRVVCREGTEASVQMLIARLDPRLRFSRDYADGVRPYAEYCEETIEVVG
jgi:tRNA(adenine34) deaminase